MKLKPIVAILAISLASCNNTNSKGAKIDALNAQSLKCIQVMNQAGDQQAQATAAGDGARVNVLQVTIDSAATENAKIGQQILELQGK